MTNTITLLSLIAVGVLNAQELTKKQSTDSIQKLEPVFINSQVIFGSKYEAKNRTGSSFYLSRSKHRFCAYVSRFCSY